MVMDEKSAAAASGTWSLFTNCALMSAFIGFAIAQAIKFFTFWYAASPSRSQHSLRLRN